MDVSNAIGEAVARSKELGTAVFGWISDRLSDLANFGGLPNAPSTELVAPPYTPPYTGGQCLIRYRVGIQYLQTNDVLSSISYDLANGKLGELFILNGQGRLRSSSGASSMLAVANMGAVKGGLITNVYVVSVAPDTGQPPDTCGNLPNPNPAFPPQNGVATGQPSDSPSDLDLVYGAPPIVTVGGVLAALQAVANALKVVGDALEGIQAIGQALEEIGKLLDKLFGDKEKEEKRKPENRVCTAGDWHKLATVDGYISLAPITYGGKEAIPYAVEVNVKSFPPSASRVLGVNSPSICINDRPLFYLLWSDVSYGVSAVREVRVLHSIHYVPELVRGFFYNCRLNPELEWKYRIYYGSEPEEE